LHDMHMYLFIYLCIYISICIYIHVYKSVCTYRYEVESNEYSGIFCTVADWLFNHCLLPSKVHVFKETILAER